MTRPRKLLLGFAVGVVAIASCGSGNAADADRGSKIAAERARIEALLPDASATEQEVLADGVVTAGEADRAASDVVDCAAGRGVVVTPLPEDGGMTFDIAGGKTEAAADAAANVFDSCYENFFSLVASSLAIQHSLPSDVLDRRNQLVADCLSAAGFDVGSWPDVQVDPDPEVESTCVDAAREELGL